MKFWQVAVLIGLGVALGWFFWGRKAPLPVAVTVTKTDTLLRVDTVETVPPRLVAQLNALRARIGAFVAETTAITDTVCLGLLVAAGAALDSLRAALAARPALRLALDDTLTAKFPIKALWVGVRYNAAGDSATETWAYRQWSATRPPNSRLGLGLAYGRVSGLAGSAIIRLDKTKAVKIEKAAKEWRFGGVFYPF